MHKKKSFSEIWDVIEISVYIIVGFALLDLFFSVSKNLDKVFPSWILGAVLTMVAFGSIGYIGLKEKLKVNEIGKHGAYAGLITGLAGAIIGIISFYAYPERFAEQLMQAVQAGADAAMVQTMIKVGVYINLVLSPAINAGIGALIAWLSSLIFKKKFEEKKK